MIKLIPPIQNFKFTANVSQMFGVGYEIYFNSFGMPGHNGLDIIVREGGIAGYGTPVVAAHDFDSVTIETDFPTKTKGNGIYLRKKLDVPMYFNGKKADYIETCYWHLSDFEFKTSLINVKGKAGDVIGLMGNSGFVFPAPSQICPHCGTHLHFGVRFYDQFGNLLDENDGYNGYKDPVPYLFNTGDKLPISFQRELYLFAPRGNDISWLQTILKVEGVADSYEPIGKFGPKTMASVIAFQKKWGLTPAVGYVGPKTLDLLRRKYALFS